MKFDSKKIVSLIVLVAFLFPNFSEAQVANQQKLGPRKQLATIIFSGLGGAILGLSTLSFYDRPQDNLTNIAYGFAVGVMIGTVYVTYRTAAKPKEYYDYSTEIHPEILEKPPRLTAANSFHYKFEF